MEFVNPLFLFGLAALAIPVIIHLFNFRKFRKVYFTNVKFIEELKMQTQRQSQLKHLLILLMRMLAIAALVLAFSQPYIPVSKTAPGQEERQAVSIYVDNSFSMEAAAAAGTLLDEALKDAREIASAYKSSDLFQLLTNDFRGKHQRFVSREDFFELLDEVEISPVTRNLSEVYKRQQDLFQEYGQKNKTAYFLSDFQNSVSDFQNIRPDTSIQTYLLPLEASERSNLYIDSAWFESPVHRVNQLVTLHVTISNASESNFEKIPVRLLINGQQRAIASFDIQADKDVEVRLPFTNNQTGIQYGRLEITDHPITYDDDFYFTYHVREQIPVLAINKDEENIYLNSLFGSDSAFVFQNAPQNQLDYASFNRFNLILLNGLNLISSGLSQELWRFVQNGGSIAVFPGPMLDRGSYREFLRNMSSTYYAAKDTFETRITRINTQSRLYDDVFESLPENIDLPAVFTHYPIRSSATTMLETFLEMQDGDIFLGGENTGRGKLYLFATPLDAEWTNFPKHAIFVPTLYKIALLSQTGNKLYYIAGENEQISLRRTELPGDQVFKIRSLQNDFEVIPEIRTLNSQVNIYTRNQIRKAGNYQIVDEDEVVTGIAFNYDRTESDLDILNNDKLQEKISDAELVNFSLLQPTGKSLTNMVAEMNTGIKLWKLFIVLALMFLLGEVILLRLWN